MSRAYARLIIVIWLVLICDYGSYTKLLIMIGQKASLDKINVIECITTYGDQLLGEQGKTIDLPALEAELSKIKGIGGKRLEEIMNVIEKFFEE